MDELRWGILLSGRIIPVICGASFLGGRRLVFPVRLGLGALLVFAIYPSAGLEGLAPSGITFLILLLKISWPNSFS